MRKLLIHYAFKVSTLFDVTTHSPVFQSKTVSVTPPFCAGEIISTVPIFSKFN